MAVSSRLTAQIQRVDAATTNLGDALSFTQTQDGYLSQVTSALNRMSQLAILAQDVTKSDSDRQLYQNEFSQLSSYIQSTANKDFNGVSLFTTNTLAVTSDSEGNTFAMNGINLSATSYSDATSASVATLAGAADALTKVKAAIEQLSNDRANIGAYQSRINSTLNELSVNKENLTAATSRIQDVDMAQESTTFARENILVQSGTAMLAQANLMPQSVLKLLQ